MLSAKSPKLVSLFLLAASALTTAWAIPAHVGRIALSVGDVKRIDARGHSTQLKAGSPITEGDRIITGGDAVTIIVFIDEGRISLRSDSELLVRHYKVDPAGVQSRLDFNLVRGSVRQISGQAVKLQPDQYRLNTPVASIGVRGTDFLVRATSDAVEAFIHEGAIVLLPVTAACMGASQTGACAPLANLAASDANRYLKIMADGAIERRNLGADDIGRVFGINLVKATPPSAAHTLLASAAPVQATDRNDRTDPQTAGKDTSASSAESDKLRVSGDPNLADLVASTQRPAVEPAQPTVTAQPPVPQPPPVVLALQNTTDLSRQLVWGQFSGADKLPIDFLATYGQARQARMVTVGSLGEFALWRSGDTPTLPKGLAATVQFDIHSAQAYLQRDAAKLPVAVSAPSLAVDFDRSRFDTSLTLTHTLTGSVTLQASGKMNDEGIFVQVAAGQRVAGAVSLNGKEVGYWFTKDNAAGVLKGVTLWNAR